MRILPSCVPQASLNLDAPFCASLSSAWLFRDPFLDFRPDDGFSAVAAISKKCSADTRTLGPLTVWVT